MGALVGLCLGLGLFLVWRSFTAPPRPRAGATTARPVGGSARPGRDRVGDAGWPAGVEHRRGRGRAGPDGSALRVVADRRCLRRDRGRCGRWPWCATGHVSGGASCASCGPRSSTTWRPVSAPGCRFPRRSSQLGDARPGRAAPAVPALRRGLPRDRPVLRLPRPAQGRPADPVGDRVVESLRMARQVGGSDLGRLLRTLSAFLREDARTRAELETRQGWTVNAARLAVAAPWIVLGLLALRPEAVAAYNTTAGLVVLAVGGGDVRRRLPADGPHRPAARGRAGAAMTAACRAGCSGCSP